MGEHQHPPALGGGALGNGADDLALAGAGGQDGADPAVGFKGTAETCEQLQLVVAQHDGTTQRDTAHGTTKPACDQRKLTSLARCA